MKLEYGTYEQSANFVKWTERCINEQGLGSGAWLRRDEWTTRSEAYAIVYKKWWRTPYGEWRMNPRFLEDNWFTDNRELAEIIYTELNNEDIKVYLKMRWGFG